MCRICMKSECPPSCPNSRPPAEVTVCQCCGQAIYEDDLLWDILGQVYCADCIDSFQREAWQWGSLGFKN